MRRISKKIEARDVILFCLIFSAVIFSIWNHYRQLQASKATGDSKLIPGKIQEESKDSTFPSSNKPVVAEIRAPNSEQAMTPDKARKLLKNAASIKDMQEQARICRETIRELCKAGYSDEAWGMILTEPGFSRDSQLTTFFLTAPLDVKACAEKIVTLRDSSEKKIAFQYFLSKNLDQYPGILETPDLKRITQDLLNTDPNAMADILGVAMRNRFDDSKDDLEKDKINKIILDLHGKNEISNAELANMLSRNVSRKAPAELWSWFSNSSMGLSEPEGFDGQMRKGVVQGMVMLNASEAMAQISSSVGEGAVHDLYQGLTTWATSNSSAANEWFLSNRSNLSSNQQDYAAKAFADLALSYHETEGAENWANQIKDPGLKSSLLEKIHPVK